MKDQLNQAVTMHPMFFDPVNKKAKFEMMNGKPSISYVEDICGVRVQKNGDVIFSMYAPDAETVEVAGISGSFSRDRISLIKQKDGYFTRIVSGIVHGFHYHNWFVDGVKVTNPSAPFCYGCFGSINFFEQPRRNEDFWFLKDVPHGDVQLHKYTSSVNQHMKSLYVYTPPTYQEQPQKKYPVLYILHGVGEDETGWIWNGKLNFILDNLIAEGKCEEMIAVVCSDYAFCKGEDPVFYPGDFDRELVNDCIPYIETHFSVKKGRRNRALAGLSLGSAMANLSVSKHQDLFAYLGVFSGVRDDKMDDIMSQNSTYPMEYILFGAGEGETGLREKQNEYVEKFQRISDVCVQHSYAGYHEWHVWRESLRDFAKNIFKCSTTDLEEAQEPVFEYHETSISKDMLDDQTFAGHLLFFDPINKGLVLAVDEKGRPAGRYVDVHPGVEITGKGEATFWMQAKDASSVEVDIWGMGRFPMKLAEGKEGEDGLWTATVSGIEPGFHYHGYLVNKTYVVNPDAPVGYGGFMTINYLEMPEEDIEEYRLRQVPHGTIHQNYFKSSQTDRVKLCYVYTPPAYEQHPEKKYPVLYLQHGGGENEVGWIWQGKLANIADNLLAAGKMKEMIIVMNTGYAFPESGNYHPALSNFPEEMVDDCIPFIDATYRTIAERENRAMAGLSMGGIHTQKIVFAHPELFAWAGIFSGGLTIQNEEDDYRNILFDPAEFEKTFKLLFVACGMQEPSYASTKENEEIVLSHNVPITVFEGYGYHDWTFWRHCLADFLPRLF
ncbi:MAG TPA: alpha/beta hydrolase-fold protein [Lachnospiraceae bacterium]|nr:alpha/beta hydrolase-fold protein [Lachnospiraceae bacterium]